MKVFALVAASAAVAFAQEAIEADTGATLTFDDGNVIAQSAEGIVVEGTPTRIYKTTKIVSKQRKIDADIAAAEASVTAANAELNDQSTQRESAEESYNMIGDLTKQIQRSGPAITELENELGKITRAADTDFSKKVGKNLYDELNSMVNDAFDKLKDELDSAREEMGDKVTAKIAAAKEEVVGLTETMDGLMDQITQHDVCAAKGQLYGEVDGKMGCRDPSLDGLGTKLINKIGYRMFNNADGRDHGYVNNHFASFTKKSDDSYVRVFMQNNYRVHGHTAHANWHIMVCDQNGNGCAHCNDPGRMNVNRWSGHQHNWWINDHVGNSQFGICKATDNRVLRKGTYQFKLYIDSNRYDIYTGHGGCGSMQIDEVMVVS